jgi:hypothetical protein
MISFFGWTYVLILTLLTMSGSRLVGAVVGFFLNSPTGSQQNDEDKRAKRTSTTVTIYDAFA